MLVVDDVGYMRSMLRAILNGFGFSEVNEAADGEKAYKMLRNQRYDLVFCDWEMPNMTGLELFEKVNADDSINEVQFIMVTSVSSLDKVKQALELGITEYVVKPFTEETLIKKVRQLYPEKP